MVVPSAGSVVLVPFPFSDLSQSKLRPAVVLADAGHGDWILCQLTSSSYSDAKAVKLENADFKRGSLRVVSYARPGKLFTLEKANRKGAKAQRLAKTMHYREPAILPSGEPPVSGFPLRYLASLRLCGYELQFLGLPPIKSCWFPRLAF